MENKKKVSKYTPEEMKKVNADIAARTHKKFVDYLNSYMEDGFNLYLYNCNKENQKAIRNLFISYIRMNMNRGLAFHKFEIEFIRRNNIQMLITKQKMNEVA